MYSHSYYLDVIQPQWRAHMIAALELGIESSGFDMESFDTVVVTGLSGVLIGLDASRKWGKELAIVRREHDSPHGQSIEATKVPKAFVLLDDFICSGDTLGWMLRQMQSRWPAATPKGIFLYNEGSRRSKWLGLQIVRQHEDFEYYKESTTPDEIPF